MVEVSNKEEQEKGELFSLNLKENSGGVQH
jgi:hypothetical protein